MSQKQKQQYRPIQTQAPVVDPRKSLPRVCKSGAYQTYKGLVEPRCCGGSGCQVCWLIYEEKQCQTK
jgi:hypothetical protein